MSPESGQRRWWEHDGSYSDDPDARDSGTFVIVNDRGEFFGWFSCSVDEFDNVCSRGVTFVESWSSARVWETRRGAERALAKIRTREFLSRVAIVVEAA